MGYRSKNAIVVKSALVVGTTNNPTPEVATGAGTALQPSVTTTDVRVSAKTLVIQPRDIHPQWRPAPGAFISSAPVDTAAMSVGVGTGAGTALQPTINIGAAAARSTGTGAANQPSGRAATAAGRATGTGTAPQAGVNTPGHTSAVAGVATGAGTADDAAATSLAGFTRVTVTRDYSLADGAPPTGTVYFTPSDWLLNNGVTIPAAPVAAPLDAAGRISVDLATNTDSDTTPAGSYYTVREEITGQPVRSYQITIPSDTAGFSVALGHLEDPVVGSGYGIGSYGLSGYGV
jgi:hypothetical protein